MPHARSRSRLSLVVLLLVAASGSVAWAKPKVAILGLEVSNSGAVDPKDATNAAKLTEELRQHPKSSAAKFELAPNSNRELQDEKLMGNCDTEKPACMAPIGAGMGADFLMYGRIEKASEKGKDGYKISIKLLNVKAKVVEENWDGFVAASQILGGGGSLRGWSQQVHAKLSGEKAPPPTPDLPPPGKGPGKLVVKIGNAKAATVFIDGTRKGQLDGGALTLTLPDGPHLLAIEATDRRRHEETVTVTGGQTRTIAVELEEVLVSPPPPPAGSGTWRGVMWGSVATGLAAGTVWVIGGLKIRSINDELCGIPKSCGNVQPRGTLTQPEIDDLKDSGKRWSLITYGMAGVVVVGATFTVIGAWKGYFASDRPESNPTTAGAGRRKRRELTITPVVSPEGGGATLRYDW